MTDEQNSQISVARNGFEQIRKYDANAGEHWSARDLSATLGYTEFSKFKNTILKAQIACEKSGQATDDHFFRVLTYVEVGNKGKREIEDYHLSRYACYLIVQNADPNKVIVAIGQSYFAIQTRRQELADQQQRMTEDERRLSLREAIREQNTGLASAAKSAGVDSPADFSAFQNQGYRGLYNDLSAADIHQHKELKKSQQILDHMGSEELAANLFRSTQAEAKIRRERIEGKDNAILAHYHAGIVVRNAIKELGGTMPEDLPIVGSIKKLAPKLKKQLIRQRTKSE